MTNISDVKSTLDSESVGGSHVKVKNKLPLVNSISSSKIESVLKKKKFVNRRKRYNMKKRKSSPSPEIAMNGHSPNSEDKKHEENGRYRMRTRTKNFVPDMIPSHLLFSSSEDTDIGESDELHIVLDEEEIVQNNQIKSKPDTEKKSMMLKQKISSKKVTSSKKHSKSKGPKQEDNFSQGQDSAEETDECKACPICGTVLTDKHSFTLHIREHNTDKQSLVCQICSKKLSSASSLDRHMYVHSGERPFKCSLCHLSFTTNGNMHRHMRTHGSRIEQVKELDDSLTDEDKMDQFVVKHKRPSSESSIKEESREDDAIVKKMKLENPVKSFKCHVCSKVCLSLDLFKSHMEIHPNDPIKCHKCNLVCKSYSCYEIHTCVGSEPSENEEQIVGFRDLSFVEFSSKKFSLIAKSACEEKSRRPSSALLAFECRTCGKAFPCMRTVRQHENVHEGSARTYCHTCKCVFATEKQFQSHQLIHRSVELNNSCSDPKSIDTKQDFLAMLGLHCVEVWNKNGHCLNSDGNRCKIVKEEELFTDTKDNCHTDNSNDFADIPSIISLTSKTQILDMRSSPVAAEPASPQDFKLDHAPMSPVVEGSANAALHLSSGSMLTELKETSSDTQNDDSDQPLSCKKCSQVFSTEKELRYHARSHSQNGQPHKCSFCSYQSVDKSTLMRHMRTHNGERPFKCSICDYAFTTKANSHRHVKKKHKLPDYKVADAIVYNPNMLESNIVETFTNDMNSNETVCKYCNTDFKYNRVLRHHLRSMNNSCRKKPFSCRNCKLGFSTKNNCIRHINQQHPHLKDSLKDLIVVNTPQKIDQDHNSDSTSSSNNIDEQGALVIDDTWQGDKSELPDSEPTSETDKISSNEELENQLNDMSEDDRVSIAQSLVSLSEGVPPQMAPLDLSVRALDLSAPLDCTNSNAKYSDFKSNETGLDLSIYNSGSPANSEVLAPQPAHSSPVITKIFEPEPLTSNILSPINLLQKDAAQMNNYQVPSINPVIPMICLSQSCPTPPMINASLSNQIFVPNVICLPIPNENSSLPPQQIVKEKPSTVQKTCQCDYCDAQFTLKSNKERHIKKKHPEHARPTRSRNFISLSTPPDAQKQTISTLSDKTRHALRTVLNTKVNNVKLEAGTEECENQINVSEGNVELFVENAHISESNDKHPEDAKSDSENIDLASVSSLINTANSLAIKQYLRDAKNCEMNSQLLQICDNAHSSSDTDSGSSSDTKKKSSYSKCKNHIKCGICPHTFPWHSSLKRHERTHTGDKPFKCFFCPVQFTTKSNRDRHVGRKHKGNNESTRKPVQEGLYRCSSCPNSSFLTQEELRKHNSSHHALLDDRAKQFVAHKNSSENASDTTLTPTMPLKANNNIVTDIAKNSFECRFCKTMYKTETDHVNHMKELHPLEYSALLGREDGISFSNILPLKKNGLVKGEDEGIEENLGQDDIFICFFCLQNLKTKELLFEHVNEHSEDIPCVCKICNVKLHKSMSLMEHQLQHMQENKIEKAAEKIFNSLCNNSGKIKSNSFLNLFTSCDETPNSAQVNSVPETVEHSTEAVSDGNLIVNLLGVEDPKVIDEMIDCAVRSRMELEA